MLRPHRLHRRSGCCRGQRRVRCRPSGLDAAARRGRARVDDGGDLVTQVGLPGEPGGHIEGCRSITYDDGAAQVTPVPAHAACKRAKKAALHAEADERQAGKGSEELGGRVREIERTAARSITGAAPTQHGDCQVPPLARRG